MGPPPLPPAGRIPGPTVNQQCVIDSLRRLYVGPREVNAEWIRKFAHMAWTSALSGSESRGVAVDIEAVMRRLEDVVEDRLLNDREQETALEALVLYDSAAFPGH